MDENQAETDPKRFRMDDAVLIPGTPIFGCPTCRDPWESEPSCEHYDWSEMEDSPTEDERRLLAEQGQARTPAPCQVCGKPFVPVQRGECSRCGSDAGPVKTPGGES